MTRPADAVVSAVAPPGDDLLSLHVTLRERVRELIAKHGTLTAAARVLQIDKGYLSRLEHGEKDAPSDDLLRAMGLRRVVLYERASRARDRYPKGQDPQGLGGAAIEPGRDSDAPKSISASPKEPT